MFFVDELIQTDFLWNAVLTFNPYLDISKIIRHMFKSILLKRHSIRHMCNLILHMSNDLDISKNIYTYVLLILHKSN